MTLSIYRGLLDDMDSRVAYYSAAFLLKVWRKLCIDKLFVVWINFKIKIELQRMMTEEPEKYQRMLQSLIFKAQQVGLC